MSAHGGVLDVSTLLQKAYLILQRDEKAHIVSFDTNIQIREKDG